MNTWTGKAVIHGEAAAQGSKRIGRNRKTGQPILLDDDPRLKSWRGQLQAEMLACAPDVPLDEAVSVTLTIYVARPKAHYGTGQNATCLKPAAPALPCSGRDIDKVARAVLDAGTAVWWRDDSRVCELTIRRRYDPRERVEVEAASLTPSLFTTGPLAHERT